jgi:hypothetical protein
MFHPDEFINPLDKKRRDHEKQEDPSDKFVECL